MGHQCYWQALLLLSCRQTGYKSRRVYSGQGFSCIQSLAAIKSRMPPKTRGARGKRKKKAASASEAKVEEPEIDGGKPSHEVKTYEEDKKEQEQGENTEQEKTADGEKEEDKEPEKEENTGQEKGADGEEGKTEEEATDVPTEDKNNDMKDAHDTASKPMEEDNAAVATGTDLAEQAPLVTQDTPKKSRRRPPPLPTQKKEKVVAKTEVVEIPETPPISRSKSKIAKDAIDN